MRTTLTLEPDVALRLKRRMKERKITLKQAVNEALRRGLSNSKPQPAQPYRVKPWSFGFKPGIDPDKLNQLVDQLEVEAFLEKQARQKLSE